MGWLRKLWRKWTRKPARLRMRFPGNDGCFLEAQIPCKVVRGTVNQDDALGWYFVVPKRFPTPDRLVPADAN